VNWRVSFSAGCVSSKPGLRGVEIVEEPEAWYVHKLVSQIGEESAYDRSANGLTRRSESVL